MARSDRSGPAPAALAFLCAVVAAACAPPVPLDRLHCPCLAAEGYACCEAEQVCYRVGAMPATCNPAPVLGGSGPASDAAAGDTGAAGAVGAGGSAGAGDADAATGGAGAAGDGGAAGAAGAGGSAGADEGDAGAGGRAGAGAGGSAGAEGAAGAAGGGDAAAGSGAGTGGTAGGGGGAGAAPPDDRAAVDGFFPPPPAILSNGPWLYTTTAPPGDWAQPGFGAAGWLKGQSGLPGGEAARPPWPEGASEIWLRTTFRIEQEQIPAALLWSRWDDAIEVYINGRLAAREDSYTPGYRYLGLAATLVPGTTNTLAAHVTNVGGARYVDLAVALNGAMTAPPTSGWERTPALAAYGTAVRQFMRAHGIPGGVLAVMKKDQIVVSRGFGWADKAFTRPMPADAVMRLAAPDILVTLGAVRTLIDAGIKDPITRETITDDTRVFPLMRAHGLAPLPGWTPAPKIDAITVRMLLDGTSGISELPGDPHQIYADFGVRPGAPMTAEDNVRWVYSMPPVRPPGATEGDGFTRWMVLRHLVHMVTGDLLGYLREAVFAPAGSRDVFIAHEPLALRDPREPGYLTLEAPSDRWLYLDNFTALATSAEAFVRYLRRYHGTAGNLLLDPVTGRWAPVPDNGLLVFFGAMPGTWTTVVQRRYDEVSYAVFFNIGGVYDALFEQLQSITNGLSDADWGL